MCSYCGCQSLPVIRLLTVQHEVIINKLGEARRTCEAGAIQDCQRHADELADLLLIHNELEEQGLFDALSADVEFVEALAKLRQEHAEIDDLVGRVQAGEYQLVSDLETILRNNISNEENGLFPASAVTLDGNVWDQIESAQGITR